MPWIERPEAKVGGLPGVSKHQWGILHWRCIFYMNLDTLGGRNSAGPVTGLLAGSKRQKNVTGVTNQREGRQTFKMQVLMIPYL